MTPRVILVVLGLVLLVLAALPIGSPVRLEWLGIAALSAAYFLT